MDQTGSFHQMLKHQERHLNISYVVNVNLRIKIENIFYALLTTKDCT